MTTNATEAAARVLIVDDEREFVEAMRKRFARRGIECDGASTALEGIWRALNCPYDLVILDMKLPDMSGLEALRAIGPCKVGLSVILLTGHASASIGREAISAGASEYMLKPVDFEALLKRARACACIKKQDKTGLKEATANDISQRVRQETGVIISTKEGNG